MRKAPVLGGVAAGTLLLALAPIAPATSQAAPAKSVTISGLDTSGFAAPLSVLIYEPEIPIPTTPQGEVRYAYTETSLQSGPFATALASSLYPGATLASGLPQFNSHLPQYPVVTRAAYPGTQTKSSKDFGPASMSAEAGQNLATATASTGSSPLAALVKLGNASSTTSMTSSTKEVTASSVAAVTDVSILGGIIGIKSVHGETKSTSNGSTSAATGQETSSGITVAGQSFTVDQKGVHGPGAISLPGPLGNLVNKTLPKTGNALLKAFGVHFSLPLVQRSAHGHQATSAGQGLVVSIDTGPFKKALSSVPLQSLIKLTPNPCLPDNGGTSQLPFGECLHDNLDAVLNLSPKIVLLFCNTMTAANGVPAIPYPGFPPPPTTPTGPTTPPVSSGGGPTVPPITGSGVPPISSGPVGTPGQGPVVANSTPTASALPDLFGGLTGWLVLLGLLATGLLAYFMRGMGLPLMGAAGVVGCEYGAPGGAPPLRRS